MFTELSFVKGYCAFCVFIIEAQINYKTSFGFADIKSFRKICPPKTTSSTTCKITPNFAITPPPFFVDVMNKYHLTSYVKTYCEYNIVQSKNM